VIYLLPPNSVLHIKNTQQLKAMFCVAGPESCAPAGDFPLHPRKAGVKIKGVGSWAGHDFSNPLTK